MRLSWRGPLAPGSFPADGEAFAALLVPAVYLRVKRYAAGRTVVYVGQTRTLLARIDQHLGQLFSFAVALRDDDGRVVFRGEAAERVAAFNDLDRLAALALAEGRRLAFYWAASDEMFPDDALAFAEAALKARLEDRAAARAGLAVENRSRVPVGALEAPITFELDAEALAAPDRALLDDLLGADALVLAADAAAAFDDAGAA